MPLLSNNVLLVWMATGVAIAAGAACIPTWLLVAVDRGVRPLDWMRHGGAAAALCNGIAKFRHHAPLLSALLFAPVVIFGAPLAVAYLAVTNAMLTLRACLVGALHITATLCADAGLRRFSRGWGRETRIAAIAAGAFVLAALALLAASAGPLRRVALGELPWYAAAAAALAVQAAAAVFLTFRSDAGGAMDARTLATTLGILTSALGVTLQVGGELCARFMWADWVAQGLLSASDRCEECV